MMDQAGMLSMLDSDMLYIYIDSWSRYRTAKDHCRVQGLVIDGMHGPRKNPWYDIMMQAATSIRYYADRMGLSPVARSRLRVETADLDPTGKWATFGVVNEGG
jgi:P27 family predicted phage terminase small subunit